MIGVALAILFAVPGIAGASSLVDEAGPTLTVQPAAPPAAVKTAAAPRTPQRKAFLFEASAGYLYSGGDLAGPMAGIFAGYRPLRSGRVEVGVLVEYYRSAETRRLEDPTVGPYTWEYDYTVIPLVAGGRYVHPLSEKLFLHGEAGAGLFLVSGSWSAKNENGAIEPAERFSDAAPGYRIGVGLSRPLGPGGLTVALNVRSANVDNAEKRNAVYPQPADTFKIAGDVGATAIQAGYTLRF